MFRRFAPLVALTLLAMPGAAPAPAQDFRAGLDAAERGDFATALRQWQPLADAGDATAQASLGGLYALGQGVPPDVDTALRWYRLAAAQGHAAAQFNLGQLLRSRQAGDRRDPAEAVRWYALAADQGNADAHYKLGLMHANGEGGPQDFVAAHMRWSIAEALGSGEATRQLDSLVKLMPAERIAEAQRRADAWLTGYERNTAAAARLRHALAERESETDRLRRQIADRTAEAAALRQTLVELDSALAGLRARVAERRAAVAAVPAEVDRPPASAAPGTGSAGGARTRADTAPGAPVADARAPVAALAGPEPDRAPDPDGSPTVADGIAAYQAGDFARAYIVWLALARSGDARAQFHLGALYHEGRGVARDVAEARHWLGVAARNGDAPAQAMLGSIAPPDAAPAAGP